ncbi:MAG: hypothetical protein PVF58_18785 [Candidatus Methanofastidiosia archaeon]|jgi:hypothetical protein
MDDERNEGPHIMTHFGKRLAELAEIPEIQQILEEMFFPVHC